MNDRELATLLISAAQELLKKSDTSPNLEKGKSAKQAKKEGKVSVPMAWVPRGTRGRVPRFVKEATGFNNKNQIMMNYGKDARFVEGEPLPPKIKT